MLLKEAKVTKPLDKAGRGTTSGASAVAGVQSAQRQHSNKAAWAPMVRLPCLTDTDNSQCKHALQEERHPGSHGVMHEMYRSLQLWRAVCKPHVSHKGAAEALGSRKRAIGVKKFARHGHQPLCCKGSYLMLECSTGSIEAA